MTSVNPGVNRRSGSRRCITDLVGQLQFARRLLCRRRSACMDHGQRLTGFKVLANLHQFTQTHGKVNAVRRAAATTAQAQHREPQAAAIATLHKA